MRLDANPPDQAFPEPPDESRLRQRLNTMLFDVHSRIGWRVNLAITALIVLSVLLSMIGTLPGIDALWRQRIAWFEITVTVLFMVEYVARCYAARRTRAYLFSFYGIVDLLAILPMLLIGDTNIAVRMLRVLRLLKLLRYLRMLRIFLSTMRDTMEMLLVVLGTIALGAVLAGNLIYAIEPETFDSAFDGAWWGIVTMTTVGYGDVVPHTMAARVIAVMLMVTGICMFAVITGVVSVKIARAIQHDVRCDSCGRSIAADFPYCPYCAARQVDEESDSAKS